MGCMNGQGGGSKRAASLRRAAARRASSAAALSSLALWRAACSALSALCLPCSVCRSRLCAASLGKNENSGTGGSLSSWGEARPKKDGYWNPAECGKTCALVSFYNVSRGDEMFRKGSTAGATSDVEDREIFEIYHGIERCWSVGHPRGWYIAEWGLPQMEGGFKRNGPLHERGGWLKVPGSPFVLTLHFARKLGLRESPR